MSSSLLFVGGLGTAELLLILVLLLLWGYVILEIVTGTIRDSIDKLVWLLLVLLVPVLGVVFYLLVGRRRLAK